MLTPDNDPILSSISSLREKYNETYTTTSDAYWWYFIPKNGEPLKSQGWKLHLSTIPVHAYALLQEVVPWLIEQRFQWKVLFSLDQLIHSLNAPSEFSQVGKFMTIYPGTDEVAIEVAASLHKKTLHLPGPVIPSDYRYAPDSQVYYRYGSFKEQYFYPEHTQLRTPYILAPDGQKVPDERKKYPYSPAWAYNPFPPSVRKKDHSSRGLFGKGLKVRGVLTQTLKGGVYVVSDETDNTFVLKEARFGTTPTIDGQDQRNRLTHEYTILQKIAHLKIAPQPKDIFDADNNRYLLMEHLPGQTLRQYIQQRHAFADTTREPLERICESLRDIVSQCHVEGLILRDLTPNNFIVQADGCKLIDLEMAHVSVSKELPFVGYTLGYVPPGTELEARNAFVYDIYALVAIFFFVLTGLDPSFGKAEAILSRLPDLLDDKIFLRKDAPEVIVTSTLTFLTAQKLDLPQKHDQGTPSQVCTRPSWSVCSHICKQNALPFCRECLLRHATAIAEHLYARVDWQHATAHWRSFASPWEERYHPSSFYGGATGIACYFCEVAQVTGNVTCYQYARSVIDWLCSQHPFEPGETPASLYYGYASVPWICTMIARGLNDGSYMERALAIAENIAQVAPTRLDMTHGAAGIGLMHLELFRHTGDNRQREHALRLGQLLLARAEPSTGDGSVWNENNCITWGFAHGCAGIAYFLLALYSQTGDQQFKDIVEQATRAILQAAVPTADGKGRSWLKDTADNDVPWLHWCHGASGIGTYLLAAARHLHSSELVSSALQAAYTIQQSQCATSLSQCHGLAGEGEYLLQASRAYASTDIMQDVLQIVRKIYALRSCTNDVAGFVWRNEVGDLDPNYMLGYCGLYGFLLRVVHPDLSRPLYFTGW